MRTLLFLVTVVFMTACGQHELISQTPPTLGPVAPNADLDCDQHPQGAALFTGSLCNPMNWLAAQNQIQALSPDERRTLLLAEPLNGDYGLMVMALLYSQPDSPSALRSLSQDALLVLLPKAPHDLHLHLSQLIRYNAALMDHGHRIAAQREALMIRENVQNAQQSVIEGLQQALMTTRQQLAEKQAQVEALTDIESNLSGDRGPDRALPQQLELPLNHDDD